MAIITSFVENDQINRVGIDFFGLSETYLVFSLSNIYGFTPPPKHVFPTFSRNAEISISSCEMLFLAF